MQPISEGKRLAVEVQKRGYAELAHGIPDEAIDNLVEHYTVFTRAYPDPLPSTMDLMIPYVNNPEILGKLLDELNRHSDTQKDWHKYRTNVPGVGKPDGYTNRTIQVLALKKARGISLPAEDPKEFYHFTPVHYSNLTRIHSELGWGEIPTEVGNLAQAFAGIHDAAARLMTKVCALIEETEPGVNQFITPNSLRTSPLRLVFYHPTTAEQLAAGHYDKSFATLQLAESHKGLRVAPNEHEPLKPVVRDANKAVFFPGWRLAQNFSNTLFQPGWHDVEVTTELNNGRTIPARAQDICARYALILFANDEYFVHPDKSQMHTRAIEEG